MSDHAPDPLVPADVDISGLDGFMLNVQRLFASELWAMSTGDEFKAAIGLWGRAWQQTPPGSLPADERILAAFSGAGPKWGKVKAVAMRGFVLCSDGRLYHRVLCEDVMTAARKREEFKRRTRNATDARRQRDDGRNDDRGEQRDDGRNAKRGDDVTSNVTSVHRRRQGQKGSVPQEGNGCDAAPDDPKTKERALDPDADLYAFGKGFLGKSAGGMITAIKKLYGGDIAKTREFLGQAKERHDPREYVAATIKRGKLVESAGGLDFARFPANGLYDTSI